MPLIITLIGLTIGIQLENHRIEKGAQLVKDRGNKVEVEYQKRRLADITDKFEDLDLGYNDVLLLGEPILRKKSDMPDKFEELHLGYNDVLGEQLLRKKSDISDSFEDLDRSFNDVLGEQLLRKKSDILGEQLLRKKKHISPLSPKKSLPLNLQLFLQSHSSSSTKKEYRNKLKLSLERSNETKMDNLQLLQKHPALSIGDKNNPLQQLKDNITPGELRYNEQNEESRAQKRKKARTRSPYYLLRAAKSTKGSGSRKEEGLVDNLLYRQDESPGTHTTPGIHCISSCEKEEDIVAFVNRTISEVVFCEGYSYDAIEGISILNMVTSQQCDQASLFAILQKDKALPEDELYWNLTDPKEKTLIHSNISWRDAKNSHYKLAELPLRSLPENLLPGEYHVTTTAGGHVTTTAGDHVITTAGGQGTVRLFTVVCYDNVHPVSRTVDIQVLCEAQGALDGDVIFSWEVPTEDGGSVRVSTASMVLGYKVEEYLMGESPISVLSIPPAAQHVSRSTLRCHVITRCGCHVTGEADLVIWDLKPHHNVTKQGEEGRLALTILGSDVTWPRGVLEISRDKDGKLMSDEMVGYRTVQQVGET